LSIIKAWHITQAANNQIHVQDQSSLDAITRQLPAPDGYYSTFRTFEGCTRVLGLTAHLRRLYEPVSMPEVSVSSLRRQLLTLLEPYRPGEARVRAIMTREGQVYVAIAPLTPLSPEVYEMGVRVETTEIQRESPRLKSTAFIGASDSERKHIAQEGIFEALLVKNENILEGMTSNFFYITPIPRAERNEERLLRRMQSKRQDILCTAHRDILLGITRKTVIDVARRLGLQVRYQPLKRDQLAAAALCETFLTSSSRGIVPVIQIDEVTVGQGRPGPITKQLMAAYETYVVETAERI